MPRTPEQRAEWAAIREALGHTAPPLAGFKCNSCGKRCTHVRQVTYCFRWPDGGESETNTDSLCGVCLAVATDIRVLFITPFGGTD